MYKESRIGEQLVLSLDDVRLQRVSVPWSGVSPRVLTKGHEVVILKAQAAKSMGDSVSADQGDLWPEWIKGPFYEGAPTLLPFK